MTADLKNQCFGEYCLVIRDLADTQDVENDTKNRVKADLLKEAKEKSEKLRSQRETTNKNIYDEYMDFHAKYKQFIRMPDLPPTGAVNASFRRGGGEQQEIGSLVNQSPPRLQTEECDGVVCNSPVRIVSEELEPKKPSAITIKSPDGTSTRREKKKAEKKAKAKKPKPDITFAGDLPKDKCVEKNKKRRLKKLPSIYNLVYKQVYQKIRDNDDDQKTIGGIVIPKKLKSDYKKALKTKGKKIIFRAKAKIATEISKQIFRNEDHEFVKKAKQEIVTLIRKRDQCVKALEKGEKQDEILEKKRKRQILTKQNQARFISKDKTVSKGINSKSKIERAPKRAPSAYANFVKQNFSKVKEQEKAGGKLTDVKTKDFTIVSKILSENWKSMSDSQKAAYKSKSSIPLPTVKTSTSKTRAKKSKSTKKTNAWRTRLKEARENEEDSFEYDGKTYRKNITKTGMAVYKKV